MSDGAFAIVAPCSGLVRITYIGKLTNRAICWRINVSSARADREVSSRDFDMDEASKTLVNIH